MIPPLGISIKNSSEEAPINHNLNIGTLTLGEGGPVGLNMTISNETFPEIPVKFSEPPLLRHEFVQDFFIPSIYKIALNIFGNEIGSISINGSSKIIAKGEELPAVDHKNTYVQSIKGGENTEQM